MRTRKAEENPETLEEERHIAFYVTNFFFLVKSHAKNSKVLLQGILLAHINRCTQDACICSMV